MTVELIDDVAVFQAATDELFTARVEHNLIATVLDAVLDGRYDDIVPRFAVVRDADGAVIGAGLRTPPWPMLCCGELSAAEADELIEKWLTVDPQLPGVNATPAVARVIGEAWAARTGGRHRLHTAMALHALESVSDPLRPTTGSLRRAGPADERIFAAWMRAFAAEAHERSRDEETARSTRALLAARRAYVWDDGGETVSMLGHTIAVDGVVRIDPVYTPPERRGRGYAGHAVAQLSRTLLADGARRCVLFTNLANQTSNKIYAEVGYRRISDWEMRAFAQAAAESPTGG